MKVILSVLLVLGVMLAIAPACVACDNQVSVGVGNNHCAVSQFAAPSVLAYPAPVVLQAPPVVSYAVPQVFSSGIQYQQTVAVGSPVILAAPNSYSSFSANRFAGRNVNVFSSGNGGRNRRVGRTNVNVRVRG